MQLDKRSLILFAFLSLPIWPGDVACHWFLLHPFEVQELRKNTYNQQLYTSQHFNFLLTSLYNFSTHHHSLWTSATRTNPHLTHFCNNACYICRILIGVKGVWFDENWCKKGEGKCTAVYVCVYITLNIWAMDTTMFSWRICWPVNCNRSNIQTLDKFDYLFYKSCCLPMLCLLTPCISLCQDCHALWGLWKSSQTDDLQSASVWYLPFAPRISHDIQSKFQQKTLLQQNTNTLDAFRRLLRVPDCSECASVWWNRRAVNPHCQDHPIFSALSFCKLIVRSGKVQL